MAVRVVVHDGEVAKLLAGEGSYSGVERDLVARAEGVLSAAQASAPVVTGEYRDNLHVLVTRDSDGLNVQIGGASSHDYEVEAATGNLARALDAARSA